MRTNHKQRILNLASRISEKYESTEEYYKRKDKELLDQIHEYQKDVKVFQDNQTKVSSIEGVFGDTEENLLEMIKSDIYRIMEENNVVEDEFSLEDIKFYGSYSKGKNKEGSDLDVIVQYSGSMREDDVFNLLHDEELYFYDNNDNKVIIDINPVNREKSGTIQENLDYFNRLQNS